jgi:hypothetical protein
VGEVEAKNEGSEMGELGLGKARGPPSSAGKQKLEVKTIV